MRKARMAKTGFANAHIPVREGLSLSSRAFFNVQQKGSRGYVSQGNVLSDEDLKLQVITDAKRDLSAYLSRYSGVLAFGRYIPKLQTIMDEMQQDINQLAASAVQRNAGRTRPTKTKELEEAHI